MQLYLRARVVPSDQRLPWRDAHNAVKAQGGLPPHVLLDTHLCNEPYRQTLPADQREQIDRSFSLWSGDAYAHPAESETFQRDTDIVSARSNWRLPWAELAKLVSPSDVTQSKTGLFIRIQDVHADTVAGQPVTIVQPASIVVIHPAVEEDGGRGKVHPSTGMVLRVSPEEFARLPDNQKRWLYRFTEMSVGSVGRVVGDFGVGRRDVDAVDRWSGGSGVASVAYDLLTENGSALVKEISLADVRKFAAGETPDALRDLPDATLDAALALAKQPGMTF